MIVSLKLLKCVENSGDCSIDCEDICDSRDLLAILKIYLRFYRFTSYFEVLFAILEVYLLF